MKFTKQTEIMQHHHLPIVWLPISFVVCVAVCVRAWFACYIVHTFILFTLHATHRAAAAAGWQMTVMDNRTQNRELSALTHTHSNADCAEMPDYRCD